MGTKLPESAKSRGDLFKFNPFKVKIVGYDTDDGPEHPLWSYRVPLLKSEAVDMEMVRNVMVNGIITPITVVKMQAKGGGEECAEVGRHRIVWARLANELLFKEMGKKLDKENPLIVVPGYFAKHEDRLTAGIIQAENEVRVDSSVLTRARDAARLVNQFAYSHAEAAVQFRVQPQTIGNWLQMLTADKAVLDAVESGKINVTQALFISKLPKGEQQTTELKTAIESGLNSNDTKRRVVGQLNGKPTQGDGKRKRPTMDVIKRALKYLEENASTIDPKAHQMLRWVAGDVDERSVGGMTKVLRAIGELPDTGGDAE